MKHAMSILANIPNVMGNSLNVGCAGLYHLLCIQKFEGVKYRVDYLRLARPQGLMLSNDHYER